jgi:hypothetical protein
VIVGEKDVEDAVRVVAEDADTIAGDAACARIKKAVHPSFERAMVEPFEVDEYRVCKGEVRMLGTGHLKDAERARGKLRPRPWIDVQARTAEQVNEDASSFPTRGVDCRWPELVEETELGDGPFAVFSRAEPVGGNPSWQALSPCIVALTPVGNSRKVAGPSRRASLEAGRSRRALPAGDPRLPTPEFERLARGDVLHGPSGTAVTRHPVALRLLDGRRR